MHYSTLDDAEIANIVSNFPVGDVVSAKKLSGGFANSNLRIDTSTGGRYLLKICNEKGPEQLHKLVAILKQLNSHGVFTADAIAKKDGSYLVEGGPIRALLFEFLDGAMPEIATPHLMSLIGEGLARVHLCPMIDDLAEFAMGEVEIRPFLQDVKGSPLESHPFVKELSDSMEKYAPMLKRTDLPRGMLHADLFTDNTIYDAAKDRLAIVDWEEICQGQLILDVAMTIVGCCYLPVEGQDAPQLDEECTRAFLAAYSEVRPLNDAEKSLLVEFMEYSLISVSFWRFRQFQWRHPELVEQKERYKEMMKRLENLPKKPFWEQLLSAL